MQRNYTCTSQTIGCHSVPPYRLTSHTPLCVAPPHWQPRVLPLASRYLLQRAGRQAENAAAAARCTASQAALPRQQQRCEGQHSVHK